MALIVATALLLAQMSAFVTSNHYCREYTPGEYNVLEKRWESLTTTVVTKQLISN